jgi:hypothetical protein
MSDQQIGRRRTFQVIDADGNKETTTVETVGLQKKQARQLPPPPPEFDAQVPAVDPPTPLPESPAAAE